MAEINLTEEQDAALQLMMSGKNVFLTGEAGTGKSTILKEFRRRCERDVVFLAPTGIAAINVNGGTLHSFFLLKPGLLSSDTMEPIGPGKRRMLIRRTKVIVIDEISMVRSDVFWAVDQRLRELAIGGSKQKPFGGKQIITVGDFFQLPPVVKSPVEDEYLKKSYGGVYAFQTPLWKQAGFRSIVLKTVHRQKGESLFLNILNDIRHNRLEEENITLPDGRATTPVGALNYLCLDRKPMNPRPVYLCTTNREAESFNIMCQNRISGEQHVIKAVVTGKFPEQDYPTQAVLALQAGARVMVLSNKRLPTGEFEYVNGDTGVVVSFYGDNSPMIDVELDNGKRVSISAFTWTQTEYYLEEDESSGVQTIRQREIGRFVQLPLKLAYAITIHKSQGMSLERVFLRLGNGCFAHGQLYTALSRCRSIETLQLERRIYREDVIVDREVVNFYQSIEISVPTARQSVISVPKEDEEAVLEFLAKLHSSDNAPRKVFSHPDIDHLMAVYRNQMPDEDGTAKYENGVGFNKMDAPILTAYAEKYLVQGFLFEEELNTVSRLIRKYHAQWGE